MTIPDDYRTYQRLLCHFCNNDAVWLVTEKSSGEKMDVCEHHTFTAFS